MMHTTDFLRGYLIPEICFQDEANGNSFTTNFTNNNIELKMIDGIP
ncbi:MAG: hypothetical protein ACLU71_13705 [Blautia hansenii]